MSRLLLAALCVSALAACDAPPAEVPPAVPPVAATTPVDSVLIGGRYRQICDIVVTPTKVDTILCPGLVRPPAR